MPILTRLLALALLASACTDDIATPVLQQHCISMASVQLAPDDPGAPAEPPRCFDTLSESVAAASNGAVQLPDDVSFEEARDALLKAESSNVLGTRVLAIEFVAPRFDGFWGSWIATSALPCSDVWAHNFWTLPGYNNTFSSAYIAQGCTNAYHYEHANMQGPWILCRELSFDCYYDMSFLDDRVSSITFTSYF